MPCVKCQGTVQRLSDLHGQYISCMMCGTTVDLDAKGQPRVPTATSEGTYGQDGRHLPGARPVSMPSHSGRSDQDMRKEKYRRETEKRGT
jgi:hypothetical protein